MREPPSPLDLNECFSPSQTSAVRVESLTLTAPASSRRAIASASPVVAANTAADVRLLVTQGPSDVPVDSPLVLALDAALRANGERVSVEGMSAWTDAALLNEAGIPAVCFGPGDISLAHAAEEYIPVDEIDRATEVLASFAIRWCA